MPMGFNAFQRELANRGIDGPLAIVLTQMYEQILELSNQGDQGARIMLALSETLSNVVALHDGLKSDIDHLRARDASDEMLQSVPLRGDDN
jgi:hypothetical protein